MTALQFKSIEQITKRYCALKVKDKQVKEEFTNFIKWVHEQYCDSDGSPKGD